MPPNSQHEQVQITKHIIRLLDAWGLSGKQIIKILLLPSKMRARHLDRYRDGEPLPITDEIMQRIEHIAGIADALRISFPRNAHRGVVWMHTSHKRFQNQTPLQVLLERDLSGLRIVRAELGCAFAWDESRSDKKFSPS